MDNYDEGYLRIAEEKLEGIHNLALERARKMVLEVNSGNDDLQSIVADLQSVGIRFV